MLPEQFADIVAERALFIARQLGWTWQSTERTDDSIQITLEIVVPRANNEYLMNLTRRLESVLEAMDWQLTNAQFSTATARVQFTYQAQPPEPATTTTILQEEEE